MIHKNNDMFNQTWKINELNNIHFSIKHEPTRGKFTIFPSKIMPSPIHPPTIKHAIDDSVIKDFRLVFNQMERGIHPP